MLKPFLVFPVLLAGALMAQQPAAAPAPGPADAAQMVNPVKPTAEAQAKAKKMYGYDCAMCHGATGDGKGDLVADMKLTMKDLTDPATLKGMSDGEIFAIIKNGKGQMSGEGDRAKPDDIWNLVIYVRSLAGKPRASVGGSSMDPVQAARADVAMPAAQDGLPAAVEVVLGFADQGLAARDALPGLRTSDGKASAVLAPQVMLRPKDPGEEIPGPFLWVWHFSNDGGVRW